MCPIIRFLLLILISTVVISCDDDRLTDPPEPPTGLVATANGTSAVDLSWSAVNEATSYEIARNNTDTSNSSTLIAQAFTSADSSYQDTGLTANITYYYWIRACNTNSCSDYSDLATVTTQSNPPAPPQPTGFTATANSNSVIDLSWSAVSVATSYQIYRNTSNAISTRTLIEQPLASAGSSYQDTGLTTDTTYCYWLRACDANGCSDYSELTIAITLSNPPALPTGLAATADGISTIDLSWSAVNVATSYQIYRNTSDANTTSTLIDQPLASASSYEDTELEAGTPYYYWVKACDVNGCSDYSSFASATTQVDIKATGNLNDSGIFWGGDYKEGNNSSCTSNISSPQDCHRGRDAQAAAGTLNKVGAGSAGFDFTKFGANGIVLTIQNATYADNGNESDGTKWSCVIDNNTGLVWEVKTNDSSSIHYKDTTYRWGGLTAIGRDYASKEGDYYDDWNDLVSSTNSKKLCGFSDWRAPDKEELRSIVDYSRINQGIDTHYFPNTVIGPFWSASLDVEVSGNAWVLDFKDGNNEYKDRSDGNRLRLVRTGQ